ncbi:hypothetical protein [Actinomycetospora flava]|uniref:Uncharacterized protein n=1 Tax=Actinomycetospora flava TaxID=3129232 RepID=A0ABU8M7A3_9PSEU
MAGSEDDEETPGITREEVIDQLRDAGLFSTRVVGGRTPDQYTDAELADLMDEFADRTVVAEELGKDVRDVTEADVAAVHGAVDHRVVQDTLGIDPGGLTPLGKMVVDAELRDSTGTSSSVFDALLGEVARGGGRSFFQAPATGPGAGQGAVAAGGGTGTGTTGAGAGTGASGGGRTGSPFGEDPFPREGVPSGSPAAGAPAASDETVVGGADEAERHGGEEVDTVFQMTTGDTVYYRTDDGEWFDEYGHHVTDPDSITMLEGGYQEHRQKGGTDHSGTLTTSGYTHEEVGGAQPGTTPDDGEVRSGSDDEPEEEEGEPLDGTAEDDGGNDDENEEGVDSASGDGASGEEDPAGGVGFTPDPDAPVLPPLESLVFAGHRPRPGQVDPADDATDGPFETHVEARGPDRFDLFGNPGSPESGVVGVGTGPHTGGGFLGPSPGQINPTRDGDVGFATTGREDDPFDSGAPPDLADRTDVGNGPSAGNGTSDAGDRGGHLPDDLSLVGDRHEYSRDFDDVPFERSGASSDNDGGTDGTDAGTDD